MRQVNINVNLPPLSGRRLDEQPRRLIDAFDEICYSGCNVAKIRDLSYELISELLIYLELLGINEYENSRNL